MNTRNDRMNPRKNISSTGRVFLVACLSLTLSSCSTPPSQPEKNDAPSKLPAKVFEGYTGKASSGWFFIDKQGKVGFGPLADADPYCDGLAHVVVAYSNAFLGCFIDRRGNVISRYADTKATRFRSGFACIEVSGNDRLRKYIIDKTGKDVFQAPDEMTAAQLCEKYLEMIRTKSADTSEKDKEQICQEVEHGLNTSGEQSPFDLIPTQAAPASSRVVYVGPASDGLVAAYDYDAKLWGFADASHKLVIKPQFRNVRQFGDGLAPVVAAEGPIRWGYVDIDGNTVIEPQFKSAKPFIDGSATVEIEGPF
jgi:hypothetical protein